MDLLPRIIPLHASHREPCHLKVLAN